MSIRLAHLSDTHIGYEAYKALSAGGENQRSVDVAKAFVAVCDEIVAADPPLVVHSGDLFDRTIVPIRMILLVRRQLQRLAAVRPDGTRRQLVLVAGNHELPRDRKEACLLHLFDGLPGVHVVTRDYEQVTFDAVADCPAELADVVVHAVPHDVLKTVDFDLIAPVDGKVNVLAAHGVAGGSELYVRSLGREFSIPTDVLARPWAYGALGHWHKQGPVPLVTTGAHTTGKTTGKTAGKNAKTRKGGNDATSAVRLDEPVGPGDRGRVWYAGSSENMGFGDLRENGTRRGWLHVTLTGADPVVERRHVPIRTMVRLPLLDGSGLTPEHIQEELIARIRDAELAGAVVGQLVENVPRDLWSLVDLAKVRLAASDALHYEVSLRVRPTVEAPRTDQQRGLGDVDAVLAERAAEILADHERDGGLLLARELLAAEFERSVRGDATADTATETAAPPDTRPAAVPDARPDVVSDAGSAVGTDGAADAVLVAGMGAGR